MTTTKIIPKQFCKKLTKKIPRFATPITIIPMVLVWRSALDWKNVAFGKLTVVDHLSGTLKSG